MSRRASKRNLREQKGQVKQSCGLILSFILVILGCPRGLDIKKGWSQVGFLLFCLEFLFGFLFVCGVLLGCWCFVLWVSVWVWFCLFWCAFLWVSFCGFVGWFYWLGSGCGFLGLLVVWGFFENESSLCNKALAGVSGQVLDGQCWILYAWVWERYCLLFGMWICSLSFLVVSLGPRVFHLQLYHVVPI